MMNPLCFVTITLHFEIRNSEMYGGNGSVGYSASSFQGVAHPEQADDAYVAATEEPEADFDDRDW